MAKKAPQSRRERRISGGEASVLKRLGADGASVGTLVSGLGSEGYRVNESVPAIMALLKEEKVSVVEAEPYSSVGSYLVSPPSYWFWAALGAVLLSVALTAVTSGVVIYLRYVFGSALILFLPGFALIEAFYPRKPRGRAAKAGVLKGELDDLVRFALSIGLSLAIVPLTGLVLNYTPLGIRLAPVSFSIAGLTIALLFVAVVRRHAYYKLARGVR